MTWALAAQASIGPIKEKVVAAAVRQGIIALAAFIRAAFS